ncbi:MBL fold metallo-hydrolase [Paenibacillus sp. NEAU-GSW1]|uniref:MBL fold metallo-hydrolase n=1 Tax=Paenibacillus sp. NEAU-GSW1 TaxID=2682486 RepID=UPI0012E2F636|nr:MBL fold metallo-hydrolase [Paenibacillus sp. NEAU-GSW1]MUT68506.1 MBL fold metallo-hydrolase [Paenibacillus sp. NEAU-GSW1]
MKVTDGIATVEMTLPFRAIGVGTKAEDEPDRYNLTLLWDEEGAILVDAGVTGIVPVLKQAMALEGIPEEKLQKLLLTHQDLDHIGGMAELRQYFPQLISIAATAEEKPFIEGERRLLKLTPAFVERLRANVPKEMPEDQRNMIAGLLERPPSAPVDHIVADGEEIARCGGIVVIHTAGHTPGHISFYLKQSRTLIAGDALMIHDGRIVLPINNVDDQLARQSIKKLLNYDIQTLICYHGGVLSGDVNEKLKELAERAEFA